MRLNGRVHKLALLPVYEPILGVKFAKKDACYREIRKAESISGICNARLTPSPSRFGQILGRCKVCCSSVQDLTTVRHIHSFCTSDGRSHLPYSRQCSAGQFGCVSVGRTETLTLAAQITHGPDLYMQSVVFQKRLRSELFERKQTFTNFPTELSNTATGP